MKTRPNRILALAPLLVAALAGCQSVGDDGPAQGDSTAICRPDAATTLVGRGRIPDAEAMTVTGAASVRQIAPGDAVTMDYRAERLTIETDPATGRIVAARCG